MLENCSEVQSRNMTLIPVLVTASPCSVLHSIQSSFCGHRYTDYLICISLGPLAIVSNSILKDNAAQGDRKEGWSKRTTSRS